MRQLLTIAGKEVRDGLRNRWIAAITLLLATLALTLAFLGSAPVGTVKAASLAVTIVSLATLSIFLVPLISLLLAHDAIVGEIERGTMALLLAHPVARWQVLYGKFLGHLTILTIATVAGYGMAGIAIVYLGGDLDPDGMVSYAAMIGSSILLGAAFLAIGYVSSVAARERATAAGIAVGLWLLFVVIYDLMLLGWLVADHGRHLTATTLDWLLLLNPADVYRLFNLAGFANVRTFGGMAGLARDVQLSGPVLLATLGAWVLFPLVTASVLFERRRI